MLPQRLSQEAERGRRIGGPILIEATAICRGIHGAGQPTQGPEPGGAKEGWARQRVIRGLEEAALVRWACERGFWLGSGLYERAWRAGGGRQEGEARVHFDEAKNVVIKANDGNLHRTWSEFFDRIALHNFLFPESFYRLTGFTRREGFFGPDCFAPLLEQPFVEGKGARRLEVEEEMRRLGFTRIRDDDYANKDWGLRVDDLHEENTLSNRHGVQIIDPVIRSLCSTQCA